ncbi:MAG: M1 family metallopeptidase [Myxococcota bacterium]|nr:M1 family metallopeptidase [Myxococcota bacterium]
MNPTIQIRLVLFMTILGVATACSSGDPQGPTYVSPPSDMVLAPPQTDRVDPDVIPTHYRVHLELDPAQADYRGTVSIDITLQSPKKILWLHSLKHTIEKATLTSSAGMVIELTPERAVTDWLGLRSAAPMGPGQHTLDLTFRGTMSNPLFGMYRTQDADDWYIFTQMEPLGAREALPCFDEPQFKTPFDWTMTVPAGQHAFFNSPIIGRTKKDGRETIRYATSMPLPTYLLALAAGPLEVLHRPEHDLKRPDGSTLPIRIITARGQSAKAELALRETKTILGITEDYFGLPYPYAKLDLVAVPDFAAGAMENPGLITYRDSLLLFEEESVTQAQLRSYANTHAHELAHIWFGDYVTMAWWDDLWLNEAFATWFAAKAVSKYRPDWNNQTDSIGWFTWVMEQDSSPRARRIAEPIKTRGDIENAFDGITYGKGYAVLAMFEKLIGEDAFRDGVRAYINEHAWGNATRDDLLRALQKAGGRDDFSTSFQTFLNQAGVPLVTVEPGACTDRGRTVALSQRRWQPLGGEALEQHTWQLPICLRGDRTTDPVCTVLDRATGSIVLPGCPKMVQPNPDGTGYLLWKLPVEDLQKLIAALPSFPEIDRLSAMSNLRMLYQSGAMAISDLLTVMPGLIKDPSPRVRLSAVRLISELGSMLAPEEREGWYAYLGRLVHPVVEELGWGDDDVDAPRELWRLRSTVLSLAARGPGSASVIAGARARTHAFLAGQEVKRETIGTALEIAAEHGDEALFERLRVAFEAERDPFKRRSLRRGLTSFHQPELYERVLNYAFSDALRANERSGFIRGPTRDYRSRDAAWSWISQRMESVRKLLPSNDARYLPYLLSSFCNQQALEELERVFEPWMPEGSDPVEGIERHFAASRNGLKRCLAKKEHHLAALQAYLKQTVSH